MKLKLKPFVLVALACSTSGHSTSIPTAVNNGNVDNRNTITALTNATVHMNADETLENATLVIQNDRILSINGETPANAVVKDYSGMHIYPGFVHLDADVGLPEADKRQPFQWGGPEVINTTVKGAYNSNEAIKASYEAGKYLVTDAKSNKKLRAAGFTSALSHRKDGIMRGTGVLAHLSDHPEELNVITAHASQHYSFDKGSSKQNYPISLMGSVALIRQTWLDAEWYAQQNEMLDFDLAAINANKALPKIISTTNWQQTLLADKISNEFGTDFVVKTVGDSYQNLAAVKASGQTLIIPLSKPKAPQMNDDLDAWNVSYRDLKKWEVAPFNPALLAQEGIPFALVPDGSPKGLDTFLKDLRNAHEHGLSKAAALRAITATPAMILNNDQIGAIAKGNFADFIVTTAPLFEKDSLIAETWTAGEVYTIKGLPLMKAGHYQLTHGDDVFEFNLMNETGKLKLTAIDEENELKFSLKPAGNFATLKVSGDEIKQEFFGLIDNREFVAVNSDNWNMQRLGAIKTDQDTKQEISATAKVIPSIPSPFNAYGLSKADGNNSVLIKNATVWTSEADGILENTDVLVTDGKIKSIGKNLSIGKNGREVDGTGKHLTAGIVDEHAHIALLSVNDIAVNSSMVRMKDAINPHDINIYRNLAGGVTSAQLLHGSANPIGGQSALIKLKWGVEHPEDLLIEGAEGFIKFALGENVKRSRNQESVRYPLTRMGVEQVYRDAFTQALAYEQAWKDYNKLSSRAKKKTTAPRKDLVMDATLEVINQQRYVSCHSYVQSEINMLMHVADDFGFNVNTFTHILEGYKVADKMKAHGVGASTFSDWWAFKWEVNYAIPYNAALMNNAGVVTAINSDSAEMSRRLNQEAAKSIKYGGLSEEEAWKLVTLNPAKLLHLDERMGSVKAGKDADLVLWSDNPLSIYAKAEKTMVDGVIYYDRDQQAEIEQKIADERSRLIALSKNSKGPKAPFKTQPMKTYECESITGHKHIDHLFFTGAIK